MTQELLSWDAYATQWQPLLNEQPIPARRAQVSCDLPIAVTVRLVWEDDGVEWLDTHAWAWTRGAVLVELHDRRRQTIGAWLPTRDVRRRPVAPAPPHRPDPARIIGLGTAAGRKDGERKEGIS